MFIFATKPGPERLAEIMRSDLVHLSRLGAYPGICRRVLTQTGDEATADIHLKATEVAGLYGNYANLSVLDLDRLRSGTASYVYYFLGYPDRLQRGLNTDNTALLPGWHPPADEMVVTVKGSDVWRQCGGRLFYRPIDRAVVAFGDFVGVGRLRPVPHAHPAA